MTGERGLPGRGGMGCNRPERVWHGAHWMTGFRTALRLLLGVAVASTATAQDAAPPPHDAAAASGASVLMTEGKAIAAANLIRRGRVVKIGRDYRPEMPRPSGQAFHLTRTSISDDAGTRIDSLAEGLGAHSGTHLDGLGHVGAAGESARFFGGLDPDALGIEHVAPFFTRGILIDMVTVRGGPMRAGDEITIADIETALDWFGLKEPGKGDAVIFHTGWGRHWIADNDTYLAGAPGIGMAAAEWLIAREVAVIGTDTWSVEVQARGAGPRAMPVHLELIPGHGIFVHENLETERLIDAEIAEFAYIFAPVPIVGATGSIGAPLAVY